VCLREGVVSTLLVLVGSARSGGSSWTVMRCQLLIGLFEFKFDHLNMNLVV
jgi:hypothetical protein